MHSCLICGAKAIILLTSIECSNVRCEHYCEPNLDSTVTKPEGDGSDNDEQSPAVASFNSWARRYGSC